MRLSLVAVVACACVLAQVACSATFSASSFGLTAVHPTEAQGKLQAAQTALRNARATKVTAATISYLVNLCTLEGRTRGWAKPPLTCVAGGTVPVDVACRQQFDAILGSPESKGTTLFCGEAWDLLEPFFLDAIGQRKLTSSEVAVVDTYDKWCSVRRPDQIFVSIISKLVQFYDNNPMMTVPRVEDLDPTVQLATRQAHEFLAAFPNEPNAGLACAMVDAFIRSKVPDAIKHLRFLHNGKQKLLGPKITFILCRKVLKPIILQWHHGQHDEDSSHALQLRDVEPVFRLFSATCARDAPTDFAIAASRREYGRALKMLKAIPDEQRFALQQYERHRVELHYRQAFSLFLWHPSETQRNHSQFIKTALLAIKLHATDAPAALRFVTATIVLDPNVLNCHDVTEGIRTTFSDEDRRLIRDKVLQLRTALLEADPDTNTIGSWSPFHDTAIPSGYVRAFGPECSDIDHRSLILLRFQIDLHPLYALKVIEQRLDPAGLGSARLIPFDWFDDGLAMTLSLTLRSDLHDLCEIAPDWMARMIQWIIKIADELHLGDNWWLELPDVHLQRKLSLSGASKVRGILSAMNTVCKEHGDDYRCGYLLLVALKLAGRSMSKAGTVRDAIPATQVAMRRMVEFLTLDLNDPTDLNLLRGFAPMFSYEYDYYRLRAMADEGNVTARLVVESWNVAWRLDSFPPALRLFVDVFKRVLDTPSARFLDFTSFTFNMLSVLRSFVAVRQRRPELWASTRAMAGIWEDLIRHPAFKGSSLQQAVCSLRDTFPDMAPVPPSPEQASSSLQIRPAVPVKTCRAEEHQWCSQPVDVTSSAVKQATRRRRLDHVGSATEESKVPPLIKSAKSLLDLRVFVRKRGDENGALSEFARSNPGLRSLEGLLSMDVTMLQGTRSRAKMYRIRVGDIRVLYCFNREERGELRLLDISDRDERTYASWRVRNMETYADGDSDQFELVEYTD
ncbi:Uncharacterized protein PBTT_10077 [Plasmodiophora brassicae]|uniref:Uncharacterized protein n=1 Tax=Plasmodiophora brassicae TaxID=37360 RepID=A0A3P3YNU6_PLABS|nr:unnamed protein product [Plasmodiophora brassicae]